MATSPNSPALQFGWIDEGSLEEQRHGDLHRLRSGGGEPIAGEFGAQRRDAGVGEHPSLVPVGPGRGDLGPQLLEDLGECGAGQAGAAPGRRITDAAPHWDPRTFRLRQRPAGCSDLHHENQVAQRRVGGDVVPGEVVPQADLDICGAARPDKGQRCAG